MGKEIKGAKWFIEILNKIKNTPEYKDAMVDILEGEIQTLLFDLEKEKERADHFLVERDALVDENTGLQKIIASQVNRIDSIEERVKELEHPRIPTPCPSCGSTTLFLGTGNHLTCSLIGCKQPVVERAVISLKASLKELEKENAKKDEILHAVGKNFPFALIGAVLLEKEPK